MLDPALSESLKNLTLQTKQMIGVLVFSSTITTLRSTTVEASVSRTVLPECSEVLSVTAGASVLRTVFSECSEVMSTQSELDCTNDPPPTEEPSSRGLETSQVNKVFNRYCLQDRGDTNTNTSINFDTDN